MIDRENNSENISQTAEDAILLNLAPQHPNGVDTYAVRYILQLLLNEKEKLDYTLEEIWYYEDKFRNNNDNNIRQVWLSCNKIVKTQYRIRILEEVMRCLNRVLRDAEEMGDDES